MPPNVSPSYFTRNDSNDATIVSDFWTEAHTLSCLKHGSFHSSPRTTYHDTMASLEDTNETALDHIRNILAKSCAMIASDGSTINTELDAFTSVLCTDNGMNIQQVEAIANLASLRLSNSTLKQHPETKQAAPTASLYEYITSPVRSVYRGITKTIDSVLGDELAQGAKINEVSELDDVIASPKPMFDQVDEDDDVTSNELNRDVTKYQPLSNSAAIISLEAITSSCKYLLASTNDVESEEDFLIIRGNDGNVDRIILRRNGTGAGSFKAWCYLSAKYCLTNNDLDVDRQEMSKLLSSLSEEDVRLLTETLATSNHVIRDEDTITLFPKGKSSNYTRCKSDVALFQIHTTKITLQNRMHRLEQDAKTAQQNAVKAKRDGMTKLALMHMRRHKISVDELGRCATLISNLDASELRLHRAKDDVQLVETFAMVKNALRDIRTDSGLDEANVEELMLDINEEMDATDIGAVFDAVRPEIDEDKLNAEFRQLELEVASEKGPEEKESSMEPPETDSLETAKNAITSSSKEKQEGVAVPCQSNSVTVVENEAAKDTQQTSTIAQKNDLSVPLPS